MILELYTCIYDFKSIKTHPVQTTENILTLRDLLKKNSLIHTQERQCNHED